MFCDFQPPLLFKNGYTMTLHAARIASQRWETRTPFPAPVYQSQVFLGAKDVPLYSLMACPETAQGTIIGTYGIVGSLENQYFLQVLGRKAFSQQYAVIFFDWRGHGKSAELSPTLTSDGLFEGEDFLRIAAQAKKLGYPSPFWFTGYSLGGQLALWGIKEAEALRYPKSELGLEWDDIGGCAAICPNLDSERSLRYLMSHPLAKYFEKAIAKGLKQLAWQLYQYHPDQIDPNAIEGIDSIIAFDQELVIPRLGFPTVEAYYTASSPLPFLSQLAKPTLILYAADDPLFDSTIISDLTKACQNNPNITLNLTKYGGHVGYFSSDSCQKSYQDPDRWWAWNRVLDFIS